MVEITKWQKEKKTLYINPTNPTLYINHEMYKNFQNAMDQIFGISLERIFKVKQWCCLDRCERTNEREEIFIVISRQRSRAARRQHLIAFREASIWMLLWMQFYVQPVMPHFQLLNFSLLMVLRAEQWSTIRSPEWFILWMILLSSTSHSRTRYFL